MVAVVAGGGLGLNAGSATVLGSGALGAAALGRNGGERVYVNAATGNLVIQGSDEVLAGRGPDALALRTYNSLGLLVDDNGDNWTTSLSQRVWLSAGVVNAAGSSATRRDEDGSERVFTWNAGKALYISTDGGGAHDSLACNAATGVWTYIDGSTRTVETYGSSGRLTAVADAAGNTLVIAHDGSGRLASVTTASGETSHYDYNASNQLTQIRTVTKRTAGGAADNTLTRVRYGYDSSNRLASVSIDLSPEDNTAADGRVFVTRYTYDGSSRRVAGISQSDGTALAFTYEPNGGTYRLKTAQDAQGGLTTFTYDTANRRTTVRNALGQDSVYTYDGANQLVQVSVDAGGGAVASTSYQYNASGDVERITDGEGRVVQMGYDAQGNLVREVDALGNVVRRTYNAANQLLTQTVGTAGEPTTATPSSRQVYDAAGKSLLRFVISPEGRVTEHRYDAQGQRVATIRYAAALYPVGALASTSAPDQATMAAWANAQDRTRTERVDHQYDWRGLLMQSTSYASVNASGVGVLDGSQAVTRYVYDPAGRLLQSINPKNQATQLTYDGLGRVLTSTDALNRVSFNSYDDANRRVQTTAANGLVSTSTYDRLGRLTSLVQAGAGQSFGSTGSYHDAEGQLRMTQDATGARQWYLYDALGRTVGRVDALGSLEESVYDRSGKLVQTIGYATRVNTALLVDAAGQPVVINIASLRPAAAPGDARRWNVYDAAGRLTKTVDPMGAVTETTYDAAGRAIATRRYANPIATAGLAAVLTPAAVNPQPSVADRLERSFYGHDGLLLATLDAAGGLQEYAYDAAGRATTKIVRVKAADAAQAATGTLGQVRPADAVGDARTITFYNARGQVVAELDALNHLTEKVYDANGQLLKVLRYPAQPVAVAVDAGTALGTVKAAAGAALEQAAYSYDAVGRTLTQRVDPNGLALTTTYAYDDINNRQTVTDGNGTPTVTQFDALGRATTVTVDPSGLALTTRYTYDNVGRVVASTDAKGGTTRYAYDAAGRRIAAVDGEGALTEYQYDAAGLLLAETRYPTRLPVGAQIAAQSFESGLPSGFSAVAGGAPGAHWAQVNNGRIEITSGSMPSGQGWPYVATANRYHDLSGGKQVTYRAEVTLENSSSRATMRIHGALTDGRVAYHDVHLFAGGLFTHQVINGQGSYDNLNFATKVGQAYVVEHEMTETESVIYLYEKGRDRSTGLVTRMAQSWKAADNWLVHGDAHASVVGTGRAFVDNFSESYGPKGDRSMVSAANMPALRAVASAGGAPASTRYMYDAAGRKVGQMDAQGAVTEFVYDAAGQLTKTIEYANSAQNLLPNEGFHAGTTGYAAWSSDAASLTHFSTNHSADWSVPGQGTLWMRQSPSTASSAIHNVASPEVPVAGQRYHVSALVGVHRGSASLRVHFKDANGNTVAHLAPTGGQADMGYEEAMGGATLTRFKKLSGYVTVPAGATQVFVEVWKNGPTPANNDSYLFVADLALRKLNPEDFGTAGWRPAASALDRVTSFAYDAAGRRIAAVDGEGALTEYQYDAAGLLLAETRYPTRLPVGAQIAAQSFESGLPSGFSAVAGGAPGAHWAQVHNGRIEITSGSMPSGQGWPYVATANRYHDLSGGRQVTYRAEVTLENSSSRATMRIHGALTDGRVAYHDVHLFAGGLLSHQVISGQGSPTNLNFATKVGQAYVVEHEMTETESVIYLYEKGRDRSTGLVTRMAQSWKAADNWLVHGDAHASVVGTGRAFVDNFSESYGPKGDRSMVSAANMPALRAVASAGGAPASTRYMYDAAGRKVGQMDAQGAVTEFVYNAAGQLTKTIEYANSAQNLLPNEGFHAGTTGYAAWSSDAASLTHFSTNHSADWSVPGQGTLWMRQSPSTASSAIHNVASPEVPVAGQRYHVSALVGVHRGSASLRVHFKDANGNTVAHLAPSGGQADMGYEEAMGGATLTRFKKLSGYVTVPAGATQVFVEVWKNGPTPANNDSYLFVADLALRKLNPEDFGTAGWRPDASSQDRVTRYTYDRQGRLSYAQDALGGVRGYRYDAWGRVLEEKAYANRIPLNTAATSEAFAAALVPDANLDRATRHVYDAAGQLRFTVDALGGVTERVYDAFGRVARSIAHETPITQPALNAASTPEAVRALLPTSTLGTRETLYTYDGAGRLVHTAQSLAVSGSTKTFSISASRYDAFGRVVGTTRYATPVALQDLPAVVRASDLAARIVTFAPEDRSVDTTYDATGRVLQITDGEGYAERFAYDALGNKTRYTNKNGAVFDYTYDAAGRLLLEEAPAVQVTRLDSALNEVPDGLVRVQTRMSYDALGNLISRTEAAGRPESRTTRYEYDALGRQVRTIFAAVDVYDTASDSLAAGQVLRTETAYDAFGQAVASRDTSGHYSYKTYDKLGRLLNEIDANDNVTQHRYATRDGEYSDVIRLGTAAVFADGLNVAAGVIDAAAATAASVSAAAGGTRSLRTYFDRLGRTQRVEDLGAGVFSHDSTTGQSGEWTRSTAYTYTVWGDVLSKTSDLGGGRGAVTHFAYNLQGGLTRQVDAEGYVIEYGKNAFGEDQRTTQYAARLDLVTQSPWAAVAATTASANPDNSIGHDRTSVIAYDRRGLKKTETQQDFLLGVRTGDNAARWQAANLVTDYQYDGVGNTLSVAAATYDKASGAKLQESAELLSFYDALGRVTASVQARRVTSFKRDALGNAVLSTRHAKLGSVTSAQAGAYKRYSLGLPADDTARDQHTRQRFDDLGRVLQTRDAEGHDQFFAYDAAGRTTKQWRKLTNADGQSMEAQQCFVYDRLGRQTETRTLLQRQAGEAAFFSNDIAVYNAFGEITLKLRDENIADSAAAYTYAYFDYDAGGRLWRTNAEDGVDKVYLYDLQDKVTAEITSPTLDLKNSYHRPQDIPATLAASVRKTTNVYDRLGRITEQRDLGVTHLDGSTTARSVRQGYDAWGNRLSVTTSRGHTTHYRYNALNQAIEEKLPGTTYYTDHDTRGDSDSSNDLAASAVTARPTSRLYLDAWGRTVGSTDARGKTSTATYTATGELQNEYQADGGIVEHRHDNFGREIERRMAAAHASATDADNANDRVYTYEYDRLDRKTSESVYGRRLYKAISADDAPTAFAWSWGKFTLGTYRYDETGNRISETTGSGDKQSGVTTRYYFDTAGRLVRTVTPLKTLQYSHDAAGHKTWEIDALGQGSSWRYSAHGRLASRVDIGGATTTFTYDRTGARLTQTSDRGQHLSYTYFDDGRLKTIRDHWADSVSTYDHDADGNRTIDRFATDASSATPTKYRDVSMAYDELGRLRSVTDMASGSGSLSDYELKIQYDANGNRYRVFGSTRDNDLKEQIKGGVYSYVDADGLARRKLDMTFAYDAMNRVSGTQVLGYSGNTEVPLWRFYRYDKDGNRIAEERRLANNGRAGALTARLVTYKYDFAGRVSETNVINKTSNGAGIDVPGTERHHRKNVYAPWGNQGGSTKEWQWATDKPVDSFSYADAASNRVYTTENWYNADQAVTQVESRLKIGSGGWYTTSDQHNELDAAGNLKWMQVDGYQQKSNSFASRLKYEYTYLKMDGYLQRTARVSGQQLSDGNLVAIKPTTTTLDYDVNGHLLQVRDDNQKTLAAEQFLVTDNAGHIVMKVLNRTSTAMDPHMATGTYDPASGTHGVTGGTLVPPRPSLPGLQATHKGSEIYPVLTQRQRYANDQVIGTTDETRSLYTGVTYGANGWEEVYLDTYSIGMRIEEAFSADNVAVSNEGALQYTWQTGDTLRGLAETFYGDANLWYVIAEANGYAEDEQISVGAVLSVPDVTRSSNTAATFKVYDPGKIIGDTNPKPIPPPPPKSGGCGGLGIILVIVVAVAVTVVTAGAAAIALSAVGPGTSLLAASSAVLGGAGGAMGLAAAAVGGAVGSIVSQGVAMAMGMQEKFSWKNVGLGAIGAGVTAGMGQAGGVFSSISEAVGTPYAGIAAKAVTSNAITQGLAVATGLQNQFDWRAVATSALAAPAAAMLGEAVGKQVGGLFGGSKFAADVAQRLTAGVVTQRIRMEIYSGGKLDYASIAADAFGNALGESIVASSQSGVDWSNAPDQSDAETARLARYQAAAHAADGEGGVAFNNGAPPRAGMKFTDGGWQYLDGNAPGGYGDEAVLAANQAVTKQVGPGQFKHVMPDGRTVYDSSPYAPPTEESRRERDQLQERYEAERTAENPAIRVATYSRFQSFAEDVAARKAAMPSIEGMTGMEKAHLLLDGINLIGDGPILAPVGALAGLVDAGLYLYEGKRFDAGLSLGGTVPLLGATFSSGRFTMRVGDDALVATRVAELDQEGHALARHGGAVTNEQLLVRATTGVAPDGSSIIRNGQIQLPTASTAFNSDQLLARSDMLVRERYLDQAIALERPGVARVTIEGVDTGTTVGRGYGRVTVVPGGVGPLQYFDNLSKVTASYVYDGLTKTWQTDTIFPVRK